MTEISSYLEALLAHNSINSRSKTDGDSFEGESGKSETGAIVQDLHPMTQKAAGWYEKIRNAIDYGEGDQIRRRAVERLLRRRIIFEKDEHVGASLLEDLVTAGYIDSALVTNANADGIDFVVKKYTGLLGAIEGMDPSDSFKKWTRSMAAIEIYRILFPEHLKRKAFEAWMEILKESITVDKSIEQARFLRSLKFAALRSLLEQSNLELHYASLEDSYPRWTALSDKDEVYELQSMTAEHAQRIYDLSKTIDGEIADSLVWYITKKIKNSRISMELILEVILAYGERARDILADKEKFNVEVQRSLASKYSKLTKTVRENGKRALFYILITKVAVALAVEIPLDRLIVGSVDMVALVINIVTPPILLLVMTRWSLGFDKTNTEKIVKTTDNMVSGKHEKIVLPASAGNTDLSYGTMIFNAFFYVVTFSVIIGVLVALDFKIVGLVLFLTFLAIVCYFGTRVRGAASRWRYDVQKKDSLSLVARLLAFPIMRLGRWLTESFSSVNFFVFFMDMIIETPFRLVLAEFNSFMNFVRDRADDVM